MKYVRLGMTLCAAAWLTAGCAVNGAGAAKLLEFSCPPVVSITERVAAVAPPWTVARTGRAHRLSQLSLYLGAPAEDGRLVPDEHADDSHRSVTLTWDLDATEGRTLGHWVECRYQDSDARLVARIAPDAKSCAATQRVADGGRVVDGRLTCTK